MKILKTAVLLALVSLVLGSCNPVKPTASAVSPTEPVVVPTKPVDIPTEKIISPAEYADYIVQLANNDASGVPFQLSPDGKWMLSSSCFKPGEDLFLFDTMDRERKYQIDLSKGMPERTVRLCASFWSPDSRTFVVLGDFMPPENDFLFIIDVTNPNKPQKYMFEWKYSTFVALGWSPNSSKLYVDTDDREVFILDRKGVLLANFFLADDSYSGAWIGETRYATIRNNWNLWIIEPEQGTEKQVFTFNDGMRILGYYPEKNMLLLTSEADGLVFIAFDLSEMRIKSSHKPETLPFNFRHVYSFIPAPNSEFSGISSQSTFWIFNWKTLEAKNYGDEIDAIFYSPIFNGFFYRYSDDNKLIFLKP